MRETTAQYSESIRYRKKSYIYGTDTYRPVLNIPVLTNLLRLGLEEDQDASDTEVTEAKGKKRSRSSQDRPRSAKRLKTSRLDNVHSVNQGADLIKDSYPQPKVHSYPSSTDLEVPVLRHIFDIQYTIAESGKTSKHIDEDRLQEALARLHSEPLSEPESIDLGEFLIGRHEDRLAIAAPGNHPPLLQLPVFDEDIDLDDYDFVSESAKNVLTAAYVLKTWCRTILTAKLRLVLLPDGAYDSEAHELPFRIQVELDVSLTSKIFEPVESKVRGVVREVYDAQRRFLHYLYPPSDSTVERVNIPFFLSSLGSAAPLKSRMADEAMQPAELRPTLLPFQRRSVGWLLEREGVTVSEAGELELKSEGSEFTFWEKVEEGPHTWYLHRLTGELSQTFEPEAPVLGGILAEEPGLGKTMETISLILNNPAPASRNPTVKRWDPEAKLEVKAIKTTLIVTPPSLASQWQDEIAAHAPTLRVLVYDGWSKVPVPINQTQVEEERQRRLKAAKKAAKAGKGKITSSRSRKGKAKDTDSNKENSLVPNGEDPDEIIDWCTYVNKFDVVIATYATLRNDFNVARPVPARPRREDVVYTNVERPRSPLVMCEWYRVVMDEVQMVGGGKTEDMVSLIPRLSSFAVSGTPARTQVSDLIHVLKFIRVASVVDTGLWRRLLYPAYASQFATLFKYYSLRTMKANIKDELTIPQQTRYLVSIEMGRVERHVYDQTLETVLLELGLDARGVAATEGWEVDGVLLRSSIRRLRGICTHPQVGQLQRQTNDKLFKSGALKSMEEVLQTMRDQNWRNLMDDWKAKVQGLIKISQLQNLDSTDHHRYQHASETLLKAEEECSKLLKEIEAAIEEHHQVGETLKNEAAALREERQRRLAGGADPLDKGKRRALSPSIDSDEEDDESEDGDIPKTPAGEEYRHKRNALQARLRECRIVMHRVKFLQGDVYHVLGASHGPQEDAAYQAAEEIRRNLLKTTAEDAKKGMAQLDRDTAKGDVSAKTLLIPVPFLEDGGIRSAVHIEELHEIIEDVLNVQAGLLWEWRTQLHSLLTQPLGNDEEDGADGQEYQRTLESQGEAEIYLQAYQALLADYREALSSERTALAAHDAREKKLRHTKAAMKAAQGADDDVLPDLDIELQPEDEVTRKTLADDRKELVKELGGRAVKTILIALTEANSRILQNNDPEKIILKQAITDLRRLINDQTKSLGLLEADLALFRKAFNQRVLYFRQLQEISDSVAELELEKPADDTMAECNTEQAELETKINANKARQRYLDHIARDAMEEDDDEGCILCKCEFVRGFITQCAHVFCEGCMQAWLKKKDAKGCPVCRVPIDVDNLQRFAVTDPETPAPAQPINGEPAPKSTRKIEYNMIDPKLFQEVQCIDSFGDYGNKIQTLVRHLLCIQVNDPGAKSIVFSAWADSLHIMERALTENGIRHLRIDQGSRGKTAAKKFRSDPDILVLLLHGERENAGLNITCASRVFLLESVVHHGFEIQAIARIDRMGQTRSTEVFCYYAGDTVEKNILDLAARRGLSLYTKENSAGTLNVSSFAAEADKTEVEGATKKKDQKGDFITKIDDMLAVLFPHMYEDVEYLIHDDDVVMGDPLDQVADEGRSAIRAHPQQVNAEAGPSRIRY